jgi:hypothetical protein
LPHDVRELRVRGTSLTESESRGSVFEESVIREIHISKRG